MIVAAIVDGLGNQMFQYAAARRLAEKNKTVLKLDILLTNETLRKFGLDAFNISAGVANRKEIDALIKRDLKNRIRRRLKYYARLGNKDPFYWEKEGMPFEPGLLEARHDVYMHGYWSSEKYFHDVKELIRREFTLRDPLPDRLTDTGRMMAQTNSVSLHVRRGDFVSSAGPCHYPCGPDYFESAVRHIRRFVTEPHFFLFSDDTRWVTENLKLEDPCTLVSSPANRDHEEMVLMSRCRHHIIANSTFSWWGAWLDPRPEKIVVAPRQWFKPGCPYDYSNLLPEDWVAL